jgi:hypothetical protein
MLRGLNPNGFFACHSAGLHSVYNSSWRHIMVEVEIARDNARIDMLGGWHEPTVIRRLIRYKQNFSRRSSTVELTVFRISYLFRESRL